MTTDKIEKILNEEINYSCDDGFARVDILGAEYAAEKIVQLFTPKLQWELKEITNSGGDNLLYVVHILQDYPANVTIIDWGYRPCSLVWNSRHLMTGTLQECKQFCTNKVLNDFLKLCE